MTASLPPPESFFPSPSALPAFIQPMHQPNAAKVVSFQSAYDSLNRNEQHARARVLRGGAVVYYDQYDLLSHTSTVGVWLLKAIDWIHDRFAARPAPNNCSSIAAGNRLDPLPHP